MTTTPSNVRDAVAIVAAGGVSVSLWDSVLVSPTLASSTTISTGPSFPRYEIEKSELSLLLQLYTLSVTKSMSAFRIASMRAVALSSSPWSTVDTALACTEGAAAQRPRPLPLSCLGAAFGSSKMHFPRFCVLSSVVIDEGRAGADAVHAGACRTFRGPPTMDEGATTVGYWTSDSERAYLV